MAPRPVRLDQLTSLRFFAALAVVASHLWPLAEYPNSLQGLARTLFHEGYAGVSFFFMLSGFILAHTYQAKLASGAVGRGRYLALRLARIVPLHWLVSLPLAGLALWQGGWGEAPKVALNLALLQAWVPNPDWYFTVNEPSWSLSDEAFFYACFAGLAFLPLRRLGWFAAGLLALNLGVVAWRLGTGHGAVIEADRNTLTHWLTYIDPVARLLDFVVGMLVYRLPRHGWSGWRASGVEVGAVVVLLAAMVAYPLLGVADVWRMQLAYLPLMALVIWAFGQGGGALSTGLAGSKLLILLGDASFALYLVHLPILHGGLAVQDALGDAAIGWLPWAGMVTVLAVVASVAVFRWVEMPLMRALRPVIEGWFTRPAP
jgi:peptidoglycan/LPS O-acetylase OafA/YrhL